MHFDLKVSQIKILRLSLTILSFIISVIEVLFFKFMSSISELLIFTT